MENYSIIISGGGTGGHIYPALSIAKGLKTSFPKMKFLFVGAKGRMEMEKVPKAGFSIVGLWISGFDRFNKFKNILLPIKLLISLLQSLFILKRFKPNVVIGTGGFASGPLLYIASIFRVPILIQEQNSYPGITNRLLGNKAQSICVAYPGLSKFFPAEKINLTGNPVRQDLFNVDEKRLEGKLYFNQNIKIKTLLILGGSLGSKRINELVEKQLDFFKANNIQLIWQCGSLYFDQYKSYQDKDLVYITPYIKRMDLAYAASDFIISRSGASSVSELCIIGKPVIFIPSPNVSEDHQTINARMIADKKAAVLIEEKSLNNDFEKCFSKLLNSKNLQITLSNNIKKLAKPLATEKIINEVKTLLKG